jgi:CRP-like cAMP-binding protein
VLNSPNGLLSSLPDVVFAELHPSLKHEELRAGVVLAEAGSPVTRVYFPHSGIVSLVVQLLTGDAIETAMIGRDGAVNASAAVDDNVSLNKAIVQLDGSASSVDVRALGELMELFPLLHLMLARYGQVLFAEAQQSAACNASHSVETRMCRWLLRMRDLAGDDLHVTQEFLSQMLGVRRTSVTHVAGELQKRNLIRYSRGHLRILDESGIQQATCECYWNVKMNYSRLATAEKSEDHSAPTGAFRKRTIP